MFPFIRILVLLAVLGVISSSDVLENQETENLDPLNQEESDFLAKDQDKRTIFGHKQQYWAKHVQYHPSGQKYFLGYTPVNYRYTPVIKPLRLRPVKMQYHGWKPIHKVRPHFRQIVPAIRPISSGGWPKDHGWKPLPANVPPIGSPLKPWQEQGWNLEKPTNTVVPVVPTVVEAETPEVVHVKPNPAVPVVPQLPVVPQIPAVTHLQPVKPVVPAITPVLSFGSSFPTGIWKVPVRPFAFPQVPQPVAPIPVVPTPPLAHPVVPGPPLAHPVVPGPPLAHPGPAFPLPNQPVLPAPVHPALPHPLGGTVEFHGKAAHLIPFKNSHPVLPQGLFPVNPHFPIPKPNVAVPFPGHHVPISPHHFPIDGPNIPVAQPHFPIPQPHFHIPQPHIPVAQPHLPVAQPHIPVAPPHIPVAQPHIPVAHPHIPVGHPQIHIAQPHIPVAHPQIPAFGHQIPVSGGHIPPPGHHVPLSGPDVIFPGPNFALPGPPLDIPSPGVKAAHPGPHLIFPSNQQPHPPQATPFHPQEVPQQSQPGVFAQYPVNNHINFDLNTFFQRNPGVTPVFPVGQSPDHQAPTQQHFDEHFHPHVQTSIHPNPQDQISSNLVHEEADQHPVNHHAFPHLLQEQNHDQGHGHVIQPGQTDLHIPYHLPQHPNFPQFGTRFNDDFGNTHRGDENIDEEESTGEEEKFRPSPALGRPFLEDVKKKKK